MEMTQKNLYRQPTLYNGRNYALFLNLSISAKSQIIDDFIYDSSLTTEKKFQKVQYALGAIVASFFEALKLEELEEYKNDNFVWSGFDGRISTKGAIGLFVSLAKRDYVSSKANSKKSSELISFVGTTTAIDLLYKAGFIVYVKGYKNENGSGRRTGIFLTDAGKTWINYINSNKTFVDLSDYAEVKVHKADGTTEWLTNEEVTETLIRIGKRNAASFELPKDIKLPDWISGNEALFTQNRIFNEVEGFSNTDNGGRFYCLAQQMSKNQRRSLTIGGETVIEADYHCMQPSMLYHKKGLVAPFDSYDLNLPERNGYKPTRKNCKILVNILLNASSENAALNALSDFRSTKNIRFADPIETDRYAYAKECIKVAKEFHSDISEYFFSNIGLQLQKTDSEISFAIMQHFDKLDIPIFSVHDSFVVQEQHEKLLVGVMDLAYKYILKTSFSPVIKVNDMVPKNEN